MIDFAMLCTKNINNIKAINAIQGNERKWNGWKIEKSKKEYEMVSNVGKSIITNLTFLYLQLLISFME